MIESTPNIPPVSQRKKLTTLSRVLISALAGAFGFWGIKNCSGSYARSAIQECLEQSEGIIVADPEKNIVYEPWNPRCNVESGYSTYSFEGTKNGKSVKGTLCHKVFTGCGGIELDDR